MIVRIPSALLQNAVKNTRYYSAVISPFRTLEANPADLNESHLGRFYTVDPDAYRKLYGASDKGIGLPSGFKLQCTTFREASIMVRKPFLDIKRCIESYDSSLPVLRYVLYGAQGNGKTITLASLVHYAYSSGYMLVHIPWAPIFGRFTKEIQPNPNRPGYVDHTIDSVVWLTFFRHQNSVALAESDIKTTQTYEWNQRENTPAGSNLTDLIEHGVARPSHAAECVYAILTELKRAATNKQCKVMVAIDGINHWFHDPEHLVKRPDRTNVPYQQITVYEAFKSLLMSDWSGGVVVTAVDKRAAKPDHRELDTPRYLLHKDGWELLDPFIPVHVEKYSHQEFQTTLDYYVDRKWLAHPRANTEDARLELEYVSVRNPATLMKLCNYR